MLFRRDRRDLFLLGIPSSWESGLSLQVGYAGCDMILDMAEGESRGMWIYSSGYKWARDGWTSSSRPQHRSKRMWRKEMGASALQHIPVYTKSLPQNNLRQYCEEKEQKAMKTTWNWLFTPKEMKKSFISLLHKYAVTSRGGRWEIIQWSTNSCLVMRMFSRNGFWTKTVVLKI